MIVESERKLQKINNSYLTTIDINWVEHNQIQAHTPIKQIAVGSVIVMIAPNSKILRNNNTFNYFKKQIKQLTR